MKAWKTDIVNRIVDRAQGDRIIPLREVAAAAGINHIARQDAVDIVRVALERLPEYRAVLMMEHEHDSYAQSVTLVDRILEFDDSIEEEE